MRGQWSKRGALSTLGKAGVYARIEAKLACYHKIPGSKYNVKLQAWALAFPETPRNNMVGF